MVEAIKKISVQRGYDVTRYALNCFGGAGGQHACLVADALGMKSILLHPMSGLLSAYGMGLADIRATRQKALGVSLDDAAPAAIAALGKELQGECLPELQAQGVAAPTISHGPARPYPLCRHRHDAGRRGDLSRDRRSPRALRSEFEALHKRRFGFVAEDKPLVVEAVEVETIGGAAAEIDVERRRRAEAKPMRPAAHASIRKAKAMMRPSCCARRSSPARP